MLALAVFVVPLVSAARARGQVGSMAPFFLLLSASVVQVFRMRSQGLRELPRETDDLNRLESQK